MRQHEHSTSRKSIHHAGFALILACFTVLGPFADAQAPHALSAAEQQRVDGLVKQMTMEQKLAYIGGTGFSVRPVPSLKIPEFLMSDGPYGTRSNAGFPSTTYAAGVGLAASWDRELAGRVGAGIGRDARARGVHYMLGPGVNIYRSPRNGRNFEYFGEDPFLSGQMATHYITGMQEQGVSATVKHFLGNNSEYLRHDSDTVMDERTAREIYLPAFEAAVKEGHVSAVMDSYNLINGQHATENGHFNTEILRKDWGFKGVLMSDWDATYDAVGAANGGLDIEMPTGKFMNQAKLAPALQAGTVKEGTINEKVRNLLNVAMSYGWLDRDQRDPSIALLDAHNQAAALDSAREAIVLLKNTGNLLPLDRAKTKTVLLVGPNVYPGVAVGGGSAAVVPFSMVSGLQGITQAAGGGTTVLYDAGLQPLTNLAHQTKFMTAATNGEPGVTVESYSNGNLEGAPDSKKVARELYLKGFNFKDISDDIDAMRAFFTRPPQIASHRLTGYYNSETAGKYIIAMETAGEGAGSRVFVDDKQIIDSWRLARADQPAVTLDLPAGMHKVVVEEAQRGRHGGYLRFAMIPEDKIVNPMAREMAAHADAVVVEVGFQPESEGEGGDRTFGLPFGQAELIREMVAANPRTVVSVTSGGAVDMQGWGERVPALLQTWYGGQEGGRALGEVLFGDVNPSGHLPATFERHEQDNPTFANYYPEGNGIQVRYKEGIFVGYRGYEKNKVQPLFPFGFGMSYTSFKFADLKMTETGTGADVHVVATFDVTNTGSRKGAEVAQLYVGEDQPKVARPMHELKGFERVELAPGETKHVSIPLDSRSFSYWDDGAKKWAIGSNRFTVWVGDSVASLPLKAGLTLKK